MITFQVEPLASCWDEVMGLAMQHWAETEQYHEDEGFNPSFERYESYERAGWLFIATAREDGQVVGYFTAYVVPSMHTQKMLGTEDTFFLDRTHRKGRTAIAFYIFVEEEFIRRGVLGADMTSKFSNPTARTILKYLGYVEVAIHHHKRLGTAFSRKSAPLKEIV